MSKVSVVPFHMESHVPRRLNWVIPVSPTLNPIPIPSPFFRLHSPFPSIFHGFYQIPRRRTPASVVKCASSDNTDSGGSLKEALSGLVDARVVELLSREENRDLLDGLDRASERVEKAKRELAAIEEHELEARRLRNYVEQLEGRASEIAESQREIVEARAMLKEAERSLSSNMNGTQDGEVISSTDSINKEEERLESAKAAAVSAIVGTLAALPISLSQVTSTSQLILPLAITFASCALFGVTFRYTMRRDLDNAQLKTGTSTSFAFVKGLAALGAGPPLELSLESFVSHAFDGALCVSGSLAVFGFASVGLDFCFKMGLINTFPIQKTSDSS